MKRSQFLIAVAGALPAGFLLASVPTSVAQPQDFAQPRTTGATHGPSSGQGLIAPCVYALVDEADGSTCIPASSLPTDGTLLPLGSDFFVDPFGRVGLGTKTPEAALEVRAAFTELLSGQLGILMGSTLVNGDGDTLFLQELAIGDSLLLDAEVFEVANITSDMNLSVTSAAVEAHAFTDGFVSGDLLALSTGASQPKVVVDRNGRMGIGTNMPTSELTVAGTIETTAGGIKFPDGSVQVSAGSVGFPTWDYNSGWQSINPSQALPMVHSLGGSVDDYFIDLQMRDTDGAFGVNSLAFGQVDHQHGSASQKRGCYYRNVSADSLEVYREAFNTVSDEVRVRIWVIR